VVGRPNGPDRLVGFDPTRQCRLALGAHQAVFLAEFDGPRERSIYVTLTQ